MTEKFVNLDLKRADCSVAVINREFAYAPVDARPKTKIEVVKDEEVEEEREMGFVEKAISMFVAGTATVSIFFAAIGMGLWGLDYILRTCIAW